MTGLVKWNHPQLGQITFQDCRPGAKTAEPDNNTLAAFGIISKALAETLGHEGRHAAVAALFGRKLTEARAAFPGEDGVLGHVLYEHHGGPPDRMTLAEEAVILLAGPVAEKTGPPAWPPRSDDGMKCDNSDEKELARIVQRLNLNEKQYAGLVDVARMVTSHPGSKRVEERIGTMLGCGLTLNASMLKDIHEGAWREFAEETRPRTQQELDDDRVRQETRQWMNDYMAGYDEYVKQQAEDEHAKALRRECDRITREFELNNT